VPVVAGKVEQKDMPIYLDGLGTVQAFYSRNHRRSRAFDCMVELWILGRTKLLMIRQWHLIQFAIHARFVCALSIAAESGKGLHASTMSSKRT
jgi:hypothetical protein